MHIFLALGCSIVKPSLVPGHSHCPYTLGSLTVSKPEGEGLVHFYSDVLSTYVGIRRYWLWELLSHSPFM